MTRWRVWGTLDEVASVLSDPLGLVQWWPSVYLDVRVREPGDEATRVGARIELFTKGFLPYTLRWQCVITASDYPHGFTLQAEGDVAGTGVWTLVQEGPEVLVTFEWRVRANKPLLQRLSFMLRPIFAWNHAWAMARGGDGLRLEVVRRRAQTEVERQRVPPPPAPTPQTLLGLAGRLLRGIFWGGGRA